MREVMFACAAAGLLQTVALAPAATPPKAGNYELVYMSENGSLTYCVVKITPTDGGVNGELVYANPRTITGLKGVALDGDVLRVTVEQGAGSERVFEGQVTRPGADTVLGSFGPFAWGLVPARLSFTDQDKPTSTEMVREPHPELMRKAEALASDADAEALKLYGAVLEQHAGTRAAWAAAAKLIQQAGRTKADPAEVGRWAALVVQHAAPYGPRYESAICLRLAEQLASQSRYDALASEYARRAEQRFSAKMSADEQVKLLEALAGIHKKAGRASDLARIDTRLAVLNADMDRDYLAKVPPFKPATFAGRKSASDRAVVLELFTGAECPPCVAADVAFEALAKTYKPSELVLIQYHLHIPGPDPLTSPASEARWAYYRERFPKDVRGTPTTVFNGAPSGVVGGSITKSEEVYTKHRETVDRLVEEPSGAKFAVTADRHGDTLTVRATVGQLAGPGADKRLRLVLVEESIRYVGGNRLRFHHMVVRAMPGGADGFKLTEADSKHTATIHLGELRQDLTKYLNAYAVEKRPFPRAARPLDLKDLKVIALVQDDKTGEILQATVADVGGDPPGQ
jgi:hypothetical protein